MIAISLTNERREKLMRPVTGPRSSWGGFQHLLIRLQAEIRRDPVAGWQVRMTEEDADRVIEYADKRHGPGGYQERIRPIVPAVKQALREYRARYGEQGSFDLGD